MATVHANSATRMWFATPWVMLAVLCVVRTAIGFQFQSVAALGPTLVERYQTDYAGLGTLIGMYMLPGIVFAIPGGLIGQRLSLIHI